MDTQSKFSFTGPASNEVDFSNNRSTPQSEKIFQHLLSIYEKHKSRSVDEAMMFFLTSIVANVIDQVAQDENQESDDDPMTGSIEDFVDCEIQIYSDKIREKILHHVKKSPEMTALGLQYKLREVNDFSELDFPSYLSICPASIADIFNWKKTIRANTWDCLDVEQSNEEREAIYDSVLQDLDSLGFQSDNDGDSGEVFTVDNIVDAFARYQIHRHASSHCLYYNQLETLAKFFSDLYAVNLQSRFTKCSCCDWISRDRSESHSM
jgi:uncharacterized protein YejL (UPF0352 family)